MTSSRCVPSEMSRDSRCARSPVPVSVTAWAACPAARSTGNTRNQHHAPCQAPWTSTNVATARPSAQRDARELALADLHHERTGADLERLVTDHRAVDANTALVDQAQRLAGRWHQAR